MRVLEAGEGDAREALARRARRSRAPARVVEAPQREGDVVGDGHVVEEGVVLEEHADLARGPSGA